MSQKFRVKEIRIKSELANRSGIVTENMTSATPDHEVGTSFKNVQVDENGEFVVGTFCSIDQVTQPQADTLTLEDLKVTVCGTGDVDIDGKIISLDKVAGLFWGAWLSPIMWGAGTTIVNNISSIWADFTWNIVSNNWSPIIQNWFVIYLSGNPTYEIWTSWVTSQIATTVQSWNITLSATGLLWSTNYCVRPYAINVDWISYWTEVCFTTLATPANGKLVIWTNFVNETTGAIAFTCPHAVDQVIFHNGYTYVRWWSTVYSYDALNNLVDTQASVNYMVIMNNILFTSRFQFYGSLATTWYNYNLYVTKYNLSAGSITLDTDFLVNTIAWDNQTILQTRTWTLMQCAEKLVFWVTSAWGNVPHYYVIDPVALPSSIKVTVPSQYWFIRGCSFDKTKIYGVDNIAWNRPIQELERDTWAISASVWNAPLPPFLWLISANDKISVYYNNVWTHNAIVDTPTMATLGTPLFTGRYWQSIYPWRNYEFMLAWDCIYTVWYQSIAWWNGWIRKQSLSTWNSVWSFTTTNTWGLWLVTNWTVLYSLNWANIEVRDHSSLSLSTILSYSWWWSMMWYRG